MDKLSDLKDSLICLCRNILICESGYIYKCEKCSREYQRSNNGKLVQTKKPLNYLEIPDSLKT
jgi:hypothetical protein